MKKHLIALRVILILGVAVCVVVLYRSVELTARALSLQWMPSGAQVAHGLLRAGLDPEALTAAGLSAGAVTTLISDAYGHLVDSPGVIDLADAAYAQAKPECDRLERLVRSGRANPEEINACVAARMAVTLAESQRESLLGDMFSAGTWGLSEAQRSTLAAIRSNSNWDLPTEFLVVDHTEAEWVQLREALANERIAAKLGEDPDPGAQAILAQFRSNPLVAVARANLDANLDVVSSAWDQALVD